MKVEEREAASEGERRFAAMARELPARRAPRSLESRVLREIERRAARPWWRGSFAQWPGGARAAFALLGVALVALCVIGSNRALDAFVPHAAGTLEAHPPRVMLAMMATTQELWTVFSAFVPPAWARAALGAAIALYVSLFALGAAAYRWLFVGSHARLNGNSNQLGLIR